MIDFRMPNIKGLKPIKTIEQLLTSYMVAEAIIEIRDERKDKFKKVTKKILPPLKNKDKRANDLYLEFSNLVGFSPALVFLVKLGLDDMVTYKFKDNPSVTVAAQQDTKHLQELYQANFSLFANVNLYDHTLNVFEEAIKTGQKKGRIIQIAIPIIAALFHDFGKATLIREKLLGDTSNTRAYRAHADVSEMYLREILAEKYYKIMQNITTETIETLSFLVKNHHATGNNKITRNIQIQFIKEADIKARKKEFKAIQSEKLGLSK